MSSAMHHAAVDPAAHVVQFYVSDEELVDAAGEWLAVALRDGDAAIVIATAEHRAAFEDHLRRTGIDTEAARDEGRLITLDAARTLARIVSGAAVDRDAFRDVVGTVVRDAAAGGQLVRAYGEMVALLWERGDISTAIDLELAWDELLREEGCSVYCAYRSEMPPSAERAEALQRVCELHSEIVPVRAPAAPVRFEPAPGSAAEARNFVTELMRRRGHDGDLLDDARIVVSELAANAIMHARSPFTVSVVFGPSSVRIGVEDASRAVPIVREPEPTRASGQGLALVAALAREWGVDVMPEGKVVWAELAW